MPGVTHWILASQTCGLFNPSLQKVPRVEWVGATEISGDLDEVIASGIDPRRIHLCCSGALQINLEASSLTRIWTDRAKLVELGPPDGAIADIGDEFQSRWRERFAHWLARTYTRAEFPDEFNTILRCSGVADFLKKRIRSLDTALYGIFFEIAQDDSDVNLSLREVAELEPPYRLAITLVVMTSADLAKARQEVAKLFEPNIKNPDGQKTPGGAPKISRADVLRREGVNLVEQVAVVTIQAWTVADLLTTIRFTDFDYLSDASETGIE